MTVFASNTLLSVSRGLKHTDACQLETLVWQSGTVMWLFTT